MPGYTTDERSPAQGTQSQSFYDRSFEAAKQRRDEELRRSEEAQTSYIKKLKRRHINMAICCAVIYSVLSAMVSPTFGFHAVMFIAGGIAGFVLSLKEGGLFKGVFIVGVPAIAISSLGHFLELMEFNHLFAFFTWVVILALGGLVGWYIDSRD